MRSYRLYNLMLFFCSACFLFGSFWIWRGEWAEAAREKKMSEVVVVEKQEIVSVKDTKIEDLRLTESEVTTTVAAVVTSSIDKKPEPKKPLPSKINLDVPFTSQAPEKNWVDPWEDFCEEAAVLMMDAYYKKYNLSPLFAKDELVRIWEWEEKRGWGKSVEIEKVAKIMSEYFEITKDSKIKRLPRVIENPTIKQIKEYLANGNPVLTVADGKILPNPYFRNGGPVYHALIIRGYTEDSFITNDPGSGWSKNYEYKYDVLLNSIHDWNDGDVPNGRKVILVVE